MIYDLIIIGTGPAGCAASIYASRYKLKNLVLGKKFGGTIGYAHKVDNYPGFFGLSGLDLMAKVEEHVKYLGGEVVYDPVNKIKKANLLFKIFTVSGKEYQAKTVIVAMGTKRRKLNIPGESQLTGKGVSYCVTCDAPFFKDKVVALVGGSDAACSGAVHLAQFAKKIYLIYRRGKLRAEPFWVKQWEELVAKGKGEFLGETRVLEILNKSQNQMLNVKARNETIQNKDRVGGVRLDKPFKGSAILAVDGVFIEIGGVPGVDLVRPLGVVLDKEGYVVVSEKMETNILGLFAAGDMVDKSKIMQQIITAMAFGAIAAGSAYKYLKGQQAPQIRGI